MSLENRMFKTNMRRYSNIFTYALFLIVSWWKCERMYTILVQLMPKHIQEIISAKKRPFPVNFFINCLYKRYTRKIGEDKKFIHFVQLICTVLYVFKQKHISIQKLLPAISHICMFKINFFYKTNIAFHTKKFKKRKQMNTR